MTPSDKSPSRHRLGRRLYIPSEYVDEICPPGRASPDLWIGSPAADVWYIEPADYDDDSSIFLAPGQIVEFAWVECLGAVEVEIRDDGTHVARGIVPAGVTHFAFGTEVLADTLDEFVLEWRALGMELDEDRLVLVDMARWSPANERFRFEVGKGLPRFVPTEQPN